MRTSLATVLLSLTLLVSVTCSGDGGLAVATVGTGEVEVAFGRDGRIVVPAGAAAPGTQISAAEGGLNP